MIKFFLILLFIFIWIFTGIINAGFMNASFRGDYPNNYKDAAYAKSRCASFYGQGIIFGPFGLLFSPFMTGFYQHGYHSTCEPI